MDAVLTALFSPGWTPSGCKCRLCCGAGSLVGVAGRSGPAWSVAAWVRLAGLDANHLPLPSVFCSDVPKVLDFIHVRGFDCSCSVLVNIASEKS